MKTEQDELQDRSALRHIASRAFSRTAGAPLIPGNCVRLLKDAQENYPEWLKAIRGAQQHVHFESYIIHEDDTGREFADALISKASAGVNVRLIYDWMGGLGKTSARFWTRLREGGVEVRCYNPPHFDSPFGWLPRDYRKMLAVDGTVGFITGLCVGKMWVGDAEKHLDPWRDTGVEVRGPAVSQIEEAFAQIWALMGESIPQSEIQIAKPWPKEAGTPDGTALPCLNDCVSLALKSGGERGIRTPDTRKGIHAFEARAFSHSAISPRPPVSLLSYQGSSWLRISRPSH